MAVSGEGEVQWDNTGVVTCVVEITSNAGVSVDIFCEWASSHGDVVGNICLP